MYSHYSFFDGRISAKQAIPSVPPIGVGASIGPSQLYTVFPAL
jgi:hypothetical protein